MTERLTIADLEGRKTANSAHVDYSRSRSGWIFELEGIPRLRVSDISDHKACTTTRSFLVDEKRVRDLQAALAVLNGEMTLEDAMKEPEKPVTPKRKFSIDQQIEEVERELKARASVFPRLCASGKMRQSVADFYVERMEAALESLKWLRDNRERIKEVLKPSNNERTENATV